MAAHITTFYPDLTRTQTIESPGGEVVVDTGRESMTVTTPSGEFSVNTGGALVIMNQDLSESVRVGDVVTLNIDGVLTDLTITDVDSTTGIVITNGDAATEALIDAAANVSIVTVQEEAVFHGVSTGLFIDNTNTVPTDDINAINLVTMTVDQYEDAGFTPAEDTLYFLSEDPIT